MASEFSSPRKRSSLREIAEAAGVSTMTVSRAFRKEAYVRQDLRAHILALAEQMGYSPDPRISSFMRNFVRRTDASYHETLAFIDPREQQAVPGTPSPFREQFFQGAEERAEMLGYRVNRLGLGKDGLASARLNRILSHRGIRGLIIGPPHFHAHAHIRLDWSQFAAVTIGSSLWKPRINRVQHHHYMGMILALRNLRRLGRKRVALILPEILNARTQGSYVACFLANQSGKSQDLAQRIHLYSTWEDDRFQQLMKRIKPDAVLCGQIDDVPRIQSILGNSNETGIACLNVFPGTPDIAGIDQHYKLIGGRAVDLIIGELQHGAFSLPASPISTMVEGTWQDGASLVRKN